MPLVDLNLTDIDKQHTQTEPGMAHFAGTGPTGETCGQCVYWQYVQLRKGYCCVKYYSLMRKYGPKIRASMPACKYFEKKAAPVAPPVAKSAVYRDDLDDAPPPTADDYHD